MSGGPFLRAAVALAVGWLSATDASAQVSSDPAEVIAEAGRICLTAPEGAACAAAELRSEALMTQVIAEAGNTLDRGAFIDLVRAVLSDPSPEIRTSALFALAKFRPDAADTPAILALLRDPVSNVRGGAWAAAALSSDPVARRVTRRVPVRPGSDGYDADDPDLAFDPAAPGFAFPETAEYLWLTSDRRNTFQLEFLTPASQAETVAWAATLGPVVPLTDLLATDPATAALALGFLDAQLFGDPQVVRLPPEGDRPLRLVLVYRDIIFDQTGIAVVFGDQRLLFPPDPEAPVPQPEEPLDEAAFAQSLLSLSVVKPDAPEEESDLFLSVLAADGYGAEEYLDLFPDGAYAAEARAMLAGPRIILDDLSYPDTGAVTVRFQNLPAGSAASIEMLNVAAGYAPYTTAYAQDAASGSVTIELDGQLDPGVYLVRAEVMPPDTDESFILHRDLSITAAAAGLVLSKTDYAPGEMMTVQFTGMSGSDRDYVATAPAGSPPSTYLRYVYTAGTTEGSVTLAAPTEPGNYEMRAFFRDQTNLYRASLPFTVSGGAAPDPTVAPTVETPGVVVPPKADAPQADGSASLQLDKTSYAPYETITITYSGMSGDPFDYVTTVAAGAPLTAYLQYAYTEGRTEGTATLIAPTEPGSYEVRAFFREDESVLRGSASFTVR